MSRFFRENILGIMLVGLIVGIVSTWVYDHYMKPEAPASSPGATTIEERIAPSMPRIWAV